MPTRRFTSTGQVLESVSDTSRPGTDTGATMNPFTIFEQYQAACLEIHKAFWRTAMAFFSPPPPRRKPSGRVVACRRFVIPC